MSEEFTNVLGWSGEVLVGRGRVESFKYYYFLVNLEKSSDKNCKMERTTKSQRESAVISMLAENLRTSKNRADYLNFCTVFVGLEQEKKDMTDRMYRLGEGLRFADSLGYVSKEKRQQAHRLADKISQRFYKAYEEKRQQAVA